MNNSELLEKSFKTLNQNIFRQFNKNSNCCFRQFNKNEDDF